MEDLQFSSLTAKQKRLWLLIWHSLADFIQSIKDTGCTENSTK